MSWSPAVYSSAWENDTQAGPHQEGGSRPFVYLDLCIGLQVGRLVWDDENFSKSARNIALVKKADGWWLEADVEQTNGAYERRALCLEERIECFEDGTIEYV
ncbi:hypothetical protein AFLA_010103 [Aspergillus flavus NRRL3357]|nr:hypothetical protein AFLA_010103 [Aspergillus flavus NRRL3357]